MQHLWNEPGEWAGAVPALLAVSVCVPGTQGGPLRYRLPPDAAFHALPAPWTPRSAHCPLKHHMQRIHALLPPPAHTPLASPPSPGRWAIVVVGLLLGCSLTLTIGFYAKRKGLFFLPSFGLGAAAGPGGGGAAAGAPLSPG